MAIHFSVKPCSLNKPIDPKHKDDAPRSSSLGEKAAELLTLAGLRRTVSDLEDEIMLQMCALGELVYATHCGNPSDSDEMQRILEYIDDLHDEIEGHEQEIKFLRGIRTCPMCGSDVSGKDVFCEECGQSLPVSYQS